MTTTTTTEVEIRTTCQHTVLVRMEEGLTAAWVLTACCKAAAKYMDTGVPGAPEVLCCKSCYGEVPEAYGWDLAMALEGLGCPCPDECAVHTIWQAELSAGRY